MDPFTEGGLNDGPSYDDRTASLRKAGPKLAERPLRRNRGKSNLGTDTAELQKLSSGKRETIHAGGIDIGIYTTDFKNEFISLTDIAKYRSIDPRVTIHNWLRGRDVVEFLGL